MKNRLQFNRHYALFNTREEALTALRARITDPGFIPLIGEPMVFRYKDPDYETNKKVWVILAIGAKSGNNLDERDYHVIDTADLDEKIAAEIAAREELDAETVKKVIFDGVESEFADNIATLSVSANSIPIGQYEEYSGRANTPHPIHDDYSVLEAVKQVDTNFISFLGDTEAKVNGIHIVKVTSGLDANVREAYDLVNLSGNVQPNSERILIYKDSSLYNVYLGHTDDRLDDYSSPVVTPGTGDTALCFIYLKADGTYQLVAVDVEKFLQESEFEDGLVVNNHVVKVKIDRASESFLTVGPDGVNLSGVQVAIDAAQQAEEDRASAVENAIQAELDVTQVGAGLSNDGSYIHDHSANYIDEATSLANADHLLDSSLKAESDRAIAAEDALDQKVDNEINRATNAEAALQDAVDAEESRAIASENVLQDNIDAEETRAIGAEGVLQNNIDAEENRAVAAETTLQDNINAEETRAQNAETSLDSKISELSAGTESEISELDSKIDAEINGLSAATVGEVGRLDGKIDAETLRAETAEDAIDDKVDELSGVTMAFSSATVSEIARIDAVATRNKVKSTGSTIVVTEAAEGTNLEANIDSKTILSNNGELKTGLKVAALAPGELEANVREAFRLVDNDGTPVDNTIVKIYKSSSLVDIELVKDLSTGIDYVRVTYIDNSGTTQQFDLDIQQLIFEAEFKDGLTVNADGEVRVKIDQASEPFLSVGSDGVKLSGVQTAIDSAVTAEATRATAAEVSISENVATLSGVTVNGLQYISAVTDNVISACGLSLGQQGGYVPHSNTNIIADAGSLDQADVLLDQALWGLSGAVLTLSGNSGDVEELEEKVRDLSATTRSLSANTVSEIEALKEAISANTGVAELSAATVDIDDRLTEVESAISASTGLTELSAATVYLESHMTGEYIPLTDYEMPSGASSEELVITSADTVNEAIGKIQKKVLDNEFVVASGMNILNDRLTAAEIAIAENTGVTELSAATVSGLNNVSNKISDVSGSVISLSSATVSELSNAHNDISNVSGNVISLSAGTVSGLNEVSGKIGNVSGGVISLSAATVSLNNNINDLSAFTAYLSANTLGVLTINLNETELGKYCPSASTSIDIDVTGADVLLVGYQMASGSSFEELIVTSADTANEAFGKIQKQIYDNELVISEAFNDINDRIDELSGNSVNPSDYYTKEEIDDLIPKSKSETASTVSNLTFEKFLGVVTISGTSATTLSIVQDSSIWGLEDGEVKESHIIVQNADPVLALTVTLPTEQTDSRVRITGDNQLLIDPNGFGEINAMIARTGNNYTIYLITSF